jgi:hypothetical protein
LEANHYAITPARGLGSASSFWDIQYCFLHKLRISKNGRTAKTLERLGGSNPRQWRNPMAQADRPFSRRNAIRAVCSALTNNVIPWPDEKQREKRRRQLRGDADAEPITDPGANGDLFRLCIVGSRPGRDEWLEFAAAVCVANSLSQRTPEQQAADVDASIAAGTIASTMASFAAAHDHLNAVAEMLRSAMAFASWRRGVHSNAKTNRVRAPVINRPAEGIRE